MESSITMEDVRAFAATKGILSVKKFNRKADLIRLIQLTDGRDPCFMTERECHGSFCMWVEECGSALKAIREGAIPDFATW